jgi:hypothetical protein
MQPSACCPSRLPYSPVPPPALNGGRYVGEPFRAGAPHANVPVTPDASYMTNAALRSANPPPGAITQFAGSLRPGNNAPEMPGVGRYGPCHDVLATKLPAPTQPWPTCGFAAYYYLGLN